LAAKFFLDNKIPLKSIRHALPPAINGLYVVRTAPLRQVAGEVISGYGPLSFRIILGQRGLSTFVIILLTGMRGNKNRSFVLFFYQGEIHGFRNKILE